jgi:hypothetical protein
MTFDLCAQKPPSWRQQTCQGHGGRSAGAAIAAFLSVCGAARGGSMIDIDDDMDDRGLRFDVKRVAER